MKKIYLYDLRTNEKQEIKISDMIDDEIKTDIEMFGRRIGLKLEIVEIIDSEKFAQKYFHYDGYRVVRCGPSLLSTHEDFESILKEEFNNLPKDIDRFSVKKGVPDFFCYKNKDDWFFCEVKRMTGGLSFSQINWATSNNYPLKVMFVEDIKSDL